MGLQQLHIPMVLVIINPLPEDAGTINGSNSICQGQLGEAYSIAAISNADSYVWEINPGTAGTINGSGTNITIDFSETFSGSVTLSIYASNSCGDGISNSIQIESIPEPDINTGSDQDICEGQDVTFCNCQ